jgi:hypothetical protein
MLDTEIRTLDDQLAVLVAQVAPSAIELVGVGIHHASQLLASAGREHRPLPQRARHCATTNAPAPTCNDASPKDGPSPRSSAASSATQPARSTAPSEQISPNKDLDVMQERGLGRRTRSSVRSPQNHRHPPPRPPSRHATASDLQDDRPLGLPGRSATWPTPRACHRGTAARHVSQRRPVRQQRARSAAPTEPNDLNRS